MLARGNEGVAARIKGSEYSIGYVEYHFARRLGPAMAQLQNTSRALRRAERSERPGGAGGQRRADAGEPAAVPARSRRAPTSYPIVTFSWLLLLRAVRDPDKAAALKKFVAWGLTEGQALSRELGYIPLPAEVASLSLAAVDRIN